MAMNEVAPGHILVVEDDRPIAELMIDLLEMEGYRVTWFNDAVALIDALSGADALPLYDSVAGASFGVATPPGLILLDLQLPSMDGMELARRLTGIFNRIPPVILVSAQPRHVLEAAVRELPGARVLQKPFDVELLLEYVAGKAGYS